MKEKEQDSLFQGAVISPLAKEKSYGEKMYDRIFNKLINFWMNLFMAAAFTQWVAHKRGKVTLPFTQLTRNPRVFQEVASQWTAKKIMPTFKMFVHDKTPRGLKIAADKVTETMILMVPGHITIIPSVWLGAKVKPALVRWFNRRHYGEEGAKDPSIAYREAMVDAEAKPTLLGAVVGRIATMFLSFGFTTAVGSENNKITAFGKKHNITSLSKFPGLNDMAGSVGTGFGQGLVKAFPGLEGWNARIAKHYDWSPRQKKLPEFDTGPTYNRGVQDFFRFSAMDVAYTWLLSSSIHPILGLLRKIPGMTYTTHPPVDETPVTSASGATTRIKPEHNPLGEKAEPRGDSDNKTPPPISLSEIKHLDRLHPASKQELHQ